MLQHRLFHGLQSCHGKSARVWVFLWEYPSAPVWSPLCASGNTCFSKWSTSFDLDVPSAVPHSFFFLLLCLSIIFFPFLKNIGTAHFAGGLSCVLGSVGLCLAPVSCWTSSHRENPCLLPATRTLPWTPNMRKCERKYAILLGIEKVSTFLPTFQNSFRLGTH